MVFGMITLATAKPKQKESTKNYQKPRNKVKPAVRAKGPLKETARKVRKVITSMSLYLIPKMYT